MYKRIENTLKTGKSVVHDTGNFTKYERGLVKAIADKLSLCTVTIFVDIPEGIARERLEQNRHSNQRFNVSDEGFNAAVAEMEPPGEYENTIRYTSQMAINEWIAQNILMPQVSTVEFEPKYTDEVKSVIHETLSSLSITRDSSSGGHRDEDLDRIPTVYYDRGRFWVALDNGKVVGTVAIREIDEKTAKLNRMFVLPSYQGAGVGQKLLDHALIFAKEQGYAEVILNTSLVMRRAHRFYEKNGFELTSEDNEQLHYKLALDLI
jgi:GNAT superfamily N-acetyltransferase